MSPGVGRAVLRVSVVARPPAGEVGHAAEGADEALAERLVGEGVEQRVDHAVGVAEERKHLEHVHVPAGDSHAARRDQVDLEGPVRQPAHDVDGDDERHEAGHLLLLALVRVVASGARRA